MIEANPPLTDSALTLTIYHLMGQHGPFKARSPKEFSQFTAEDYVKFGYTASQRPLVADYDNATLYNDFCLKKIIDPLRDKIAILIFTPDHGEEVFDFRDHTGRDVGVTIETARIFCELPTWIWVSDKFRQRYPDQVAALRRNTHKALYNGDLPHTLIDVSGIKTDVFKPELSLFNDAPGHTNRIIENQHVEYDINRTKINATRMRYEP